MNALPQELVDLVFKFAPIDPTGWNTYNDERHLLACALVSRSWCRATRRNVWRQVDVDTRDLPGFFALLDNPLQTLTANIKSLSISPHGDDERDLSMVQINQLLAKLLALRSLSLHDVAFDQGASDDSEDDVKPRSLQYLGLREVQFLRPAGSDDLLAKFFGLFSEVHHLKMRAIRDHKDTSHPAPTLPLPLVVHMLHFEDVFHPLEEPVRLTLLPCVRLRENGILHLHCGGLSLCAFVRDFGKNAASLRIRTQPSEHFEHHLDLSGCHRLVVLHLKLNSRRPDLNIRKVQYLARTLGTLSIIEPMKFRIKIELELIFDSNGVLGVKNADNIKHDLNRIDARIAKERDVKMEVVFFSRVQTVLATLLPHLREAPASYIGTEDFAHEHLPRLWKRRVLKMSALRAYVYLDRYPVWDDDYSDYSD